MTLKYAVIGKQIDYSKSPQMHMHHFKYKHVDATYTIYNLNSIAKEIDNLRQYNGFNVTVPYKELIIPYLDKISNEAKRVNAVNTVQVINGRLSGYNTDVYGFHKLLKLNIDLSVSYKPLIIGAGGASRAVYDVLKHQLKMPVTVANRTEKHALKFADFTEIISLDEAEQSLDAYDLVINCTPVGVQDKSSVIDIKIVNKKATFIDLNYQDQLTFLDQANRLGAHVINGKDMLVYQAAKAYEIWFEEEADAPSMYKAFEQPINKIDL